MKYCYLLLYVELFANSSTRSLQPTDAISDSATGNVDAHAEGNLSTYGRLRPKTEGPVLTDEEESLGTFSRDLW